MKKLYIYPYNSGSESAKLLAERLGAKRIKLQNSTYEYNPDKHIVINWGNTNCPYPALNPGNILKNTIDKLSFFRLLVSQGLLYSVPAYWTHPHDIPDDAFPVLCRTTTTGRDGAGIVVAKSREELVNAQLYTRLYEAAAEFRVTVFKGHGVTDVQAKQKRAGVECLSEIIKTYANGWGFVRRNPEQFPGLVAFAENLLEYTGMDFAGFDIMYVDGKYIVLEANSAMGLEGQALEKFAAAVEEYVKRIEETEKTEAPALLPAEQHFTIKIQEALDAGNYPEVIRLAAQQI